VPTRNWVIRILTSHAGSLPRPEDLIALNERRAAGDFTDEAEYLSRLRAAVADVVARQRDDGIDRVNDAVGRENVIASTDCGLGGRVHPQIAWAKLNTLVRGAELASGRLWS
jgi:methionine synthase II (cobalamin-independent)